jgi:sugar lactone lactonase YvrE
MNNSKFLLLSAFLTITSASRADTIFVSDGSHSLVKRYDASGHGTNIAAVNVPEGLVVDVRGNLLVPAFYDNKIIKVTPTGQTSVWASTGLSGAEGGVMDTNGNFYVANWGNGTISKFDTNGVPSVYASGLSGPYGLALDASGNLFVCNIGNNTILKFDAPGHSILFANTNLNAPLGLAFDTAGYLYVANAGVPNIVKFATNGASTIFATTPLNNVNGIAFDSSGSLYAANWGDNTIAKFDTNGSGSLFVTNGLSNPTYLAIVPSTLVVGLSVTPVSAAIGVGTNQAFVATIKYIDGSSASLTNGTVTWSSSVPLVASVTTNGVATGLSSGTTSIRATAGALNATALLSVAVTNKPNTIFVSDGSHSLVKRYDINGNGTTIAAVTVPEGLVVDARGNLFVPAFYDNQIIKITYTGQTSVWASTGLSGAEGGVMDTNGNFYVANWGNGTISKFDTNGVPSLYASGLSGPYGLALDASGNLFVCSIGDNTILKFDAPGHSVLFANTNLNVPLGLAFDAAGYLYVANAGANNIVKFAINGASTIFASTLLNNVNGIAFDSNGNLYAANWGDNTIAKFDANGNGSLFVTNGLSNPTYLAIVPSTLVDGVSVTPVSAAIGIGTNQAFAATIHYIDGSSAPLSNGAATWSSSAPLVASITTNGVATGLSQGTTTITAASELVSGAALLSVVVPPQVTTQPQTIIAGPNGTISLLVNATGGALSYHWLLNGTNIANATQSVLTLTNLNANEVGVYSVVVSNVAGATTNSLYTLSLFGINMYAGLTIIGQVGDTYRIDYWNDLGTNPTPLTNITLTTSPYLFIDTTSSAFSHRFYRAVLLP